jgi:hypothetical protein
VKRVRLLALAVLVLVACWPLLGPFRLLAVGLHEAGHVLLAAVTGGRILEMRVLPGDGRTVTMGGIPVLVLNGGYLGSVTASALLLRAARIWRTRMPILGCLLTATGACCACFALFDIEEAIRQVGGGDSTSDAAQLAAVTGVPALAWLLAWMAVAALVLVSALRAGAGVAVEKPG